MALGRDVGPSSAFADERAQGVGIVVLVGHQHRAGSKMADQFGGAGDVTGLARRQVELDRAPLRIDEGMDLSGETASRATETTISTPLSPVAPCWWTRTTVVSIIWTSRRKPSGRCRLRRGDAGRAQVHLAG